MTRSVITLNSFVLLTYHPDHFLIPEAVYLAAAVASISKEIPLATLRSA